MAKKKKHEEHENLERWLVSYADFITLLFATFVVLYALSQLDLAKFKLLKVSIQDAFSNTLIQGKGAEKEVFESSGKDVLNESKQGDDVHILPPIAPNLEPKQMEKVKEEMEKSIEKGELKGVGVKMESRGLVITLMNSVFFDSGNAAVNPESAKILDKVAFLIKKNFPSNQISVEGHTDNTPSNSTLYPSNWELSSARASSVVRYLISRFKMSKNLFLAVGYAEVKPVSLNDTEPGRQKNRRVEVVILNSPPTKAGKTGGSSSGSGSETGEKQDDIQIIKGGRIGTELNDLDKNTPQEQPKQSTFKPIEEKKPEIKPIEMPVSSTEKKVQKVVSVESKSMR